MHGKVALRSLRVHRHHYLFILAPASLRGTQTARRQPLSRQDHPESLHQRFHATGKHLGIQSPAHRTAQTTAFRQPLLSLQAIPGWSISLLPASLVPAAGTRRSSTFARPAAPARSLKLPPPLWARPARQPSFSFIRQSITFRSALSLRSILRLPPAPARLLSRPLARSRSIPSSTTSASRRTRS